MSTTTTRTTRYLPDVDVSRPIPADLVLPPLSPMQSLVARGVADGLSNVETAERLCIGYTTVKNHVSDICHRLGVVHPDGKDCRMSVRVLVARWVWENERAS